MKRPFLFLLHLLVMSLTLANLQVLADEVRPMQPDGRLLLEVSSGQFVISGSENNELRVSVPPEGRSLMPEITGSEEAWTLRFGAMDSEDPIAIHLPQAAELEVRGGHAGLVVRDMNGPRLQLQTVSGPVHIEDSRPRRLVVDSVDGPLRLDSLGRAESRLSSLDGAILARGASERVWLRTLSGQVGLNLRNLLDLDVESLSGSLSAYLQPLEDAVLRARTHSGPMRIELPEGTGLNLHAESHQGSISSEFGGDVVPGQGSNRRLAHRSGSGSVRAELRSVESTIEVAKRPPTARVLVFRERPHFSPGGALRQRRHAFRPPSMESKIEFGIDGQRRVSLQPGQYAEFDLPLDSRQIFARHTNIRSPVELEVVSLEPALYCFSISRSRDWTGTYDQPRVQVEFQLANVPCPEPEELAEFERVEAD